PRPHRAQVGEERVEIVLAEPGVGRHLTITEGLWVPDEGANLRFGPVGEDVLRQVQIGADAASFAVDRVAAQAVAAKEGEAAVGGAVGRLAVGGDAGIGDAGIDDGDRVELPGARMTHEGLAAAPDEIEGPRRDLLWTDGGEARCV